MIHVQTKPIQLQSCDRDRNAKLQEGCLKPTYDFHIFYIDNSDNWAVIRHITLFREYQGNMQVNRLLRAWDLSATL